MMAFLTFCRLLTLCSDCFYARRRGTEIPKIPLTLLLRILFYPLFLWQFSAFINFFGQESTIFIKRKLGNFLFRCYAVLNSRGFRSFLRTSFLIKTFFRPLVRKGSS